MKKIAYTIADQNNLKYAKALENSLRKFHTEKELPLLIVGPKQIAAQNDPKFFYRATPIIAKGLLKDYDMAIKIDADSIITGDLSHIWKDKQEWDIGCVLNSNPREMKKTKVQFWDVNPLEYMNAGFVVMKNRELVDWWLNLCNSRYYPNYQYKEQDFMNLIFWYGPYKNKCLDWTDNWHGLVAKGYYPYVELNDKKELILPKNAEWPQDGDKKIKVVHVAGGHNKDNWELWFDEKVRKHIQSLINE